MPLTVLRTAHEGATFHAGDAGFVWEALSRPAPSREDLRGRSPDGRFPTNDVVILDGPRRIFWKEAWLRPVHAADATTETSEVGLGALRSCLKVKSDEQHYFCQSTELLRATEPFPGRQKVWKTRIVLREIWSGDLSVLEVLRLCARWSWQWLWLMYWREIWLERLNRSGT